jgi:acetyl-CoA acetyltransferase
MPGQLFKAAAIVGAAEANEIGFLETPATSLQLHIEAIKNLSRQTGVPISKIDGVFSTDGPRALRAPRVRQVHRHHVGGGGRSKAVHHALAAIHAGIIEVALISHGENGHSARKIGGGGFGNYGRGAGALSPAVEMTMAYGLSGAPSNYAHAMVRHMHRYGTRREDYAHIAKVSRDWATLNPRAAMYSKKKPPFGGPITVEQVESSRLIAWPLTILHCCMVTDHGGAALVCIRGSQPAQHQTGLDCRCRRAWGTATCWRWLTSRPRPRHAP